MKKRKINSIDKVTKRKNITLCFILSFVIISLSIGFSSYLNNLSIKDATLTVRIDKDVRVMGVSVNSVNDAVSSYEDYNVSNITSNVKLSSADSYVIYDVDVYNLGNIDVAIGSYTIDNDNLNVEFLNYNIKDRICVDNLCNLGVKKKIQVKVSYKDGKYDDSNLIQSFKIKFNFATVYSVSYEGFDSSDSLNKYAVDGTSFSESFTFDSSKTLSVTMNDKLLSEGSDYTYSDGVLKVLNVDGNIVVKLSDMSYMKEKVVANYTSSGSEDDLTLFDLDSMSSDDKTSNFSNAATESGVYRIKGITGTGNSLVFRGNVTNNYVSFGGLIWRITQIDEDGNLRLILNNIVSTSQYNTTSSISSVEEAETILSYSNSSVKTALDSWYTSTLSSYSEYIVTSKFCNDFTYETKSSSGASNDTYYYQSYLNVGVDAALYSPSLVCPSAYTFTSNIGLISAEEVVLAGGAYRVAATSSYLYVSSSGWWTLSPGYYDPTQGNGGVFFVDSSGALTDWSRSLLTASYGLRPVITINGNLALSGSGTLSDPYRLASETIKTIAKYDVTDLSKLNDGKFYIANTGGAYSVDGVLSSTVSGIGLVGTNMATFSDDKSTIASTTGALFTFENGEETTDGYLYEIKTSDNKYLSINDDYSVTLSDTAVKCKVSIVSNSSYSGRVIISNSDGTMYLNFYGAANTADDKFAGWNEEDANDYMILYKESE